MADTRCHFVGERIEDEYRYVSALGKPSKEPVLAVRLERTETWQGGVVAAALHAADFCRVTWANPPNRIRKIRYVDENYSRKLFEVQEIDDTPAPPLPIPDCDVLAVCDFGHGAFTKQTMFNLCDFVGGRYLALAVQTNAANSGFNLVTKWPAADYIVIDEPEARLAAQDRHGPIEAVMRRIAEHFPHLHRLIVTHGRHGAYGLQFGELYGQFHHCPAFTSTALDTMGAGDAFFAITAPIAEKMEATMPELLMIGNAAGALKTRILGHRKAINKHDLIDFINSNA